MSDAETNMAALEKLPRDWQPLVYEFGLSIVIALWNDGARTRQKEAECLRCGAPLGIITPGRGIK